jgi:hypothetical protein
MGDGGCPVITDMAREYRGNHSCKKEARSSAGKFFYAGNYLRPMENPEGNG